MYCWLRHKWTTNAEGVVWTVTLILGVLSCIICFGIAIAKFGTPDGGWYIIGGLIAYGIFSIPGGIIGTILMERRHKHSQLIREKYYKYQKETDAIREELGISEFFRV